MRVPGWAGNLKWIDTCWDWLQDFKKSHISFDEGPVGHSKVVQIVKRLGMERTDIIRLPQKESGERFKDCNECLQAGVSLERIAESRPNSEILRPAALRIIYDFEKEIWEKYPSTYEGELNWGG